MRPAMPRPRPVRQRGSARRCPQGAAAAGFSLLEVLLATAILVGCLVVLSELAAIGRQHAQDAQTRTAAQTLCETKVNAILAGLEAPESVADQPLADAPGWLYAVDTQTLPQPGLLRLQVTVKADRDGGAKREFTLVQWIRDPQYRFREDASSAGVPRPPGLRGGRRP